MKKILLILFLLFSASSSFAATNYCDDANCMGCFKMEDTGNESDLSGEGNTLTETGGTIDRVTDKQVNTYARDFESVDTEWFSHADALSTDISGADQNLTITAWVKLESEGSNRVIVSKYYSGSEAQRQYLLYYESASDKFNCTIADTATTFEDATGNTSISAGTWYHVACVYDDVNITLYVDGSEDTGGDNPDAFTSGINDSTAEFRIGVQRFNAAENGYMDGIIDDVGIFNRALSAAEISEIYNNGLDGTNEASGSGRKRMML